MTYSEKLQSPKWQKKRLEILQRDEFTCQCCGDTETTLHVHHLSYDKNKEPWQYKNNNMTTLCKHCHELETYIKKEVNRSVIGLRVVKENLGFGMYALFSKTEDSILYAEINKDYYIMVRFFLNNGVFIKNIKKLING